MAAIYIGTKKKNTTSSSSSSKSSSSKSSGYTDPLSSVQSALSNGSWSAGDSGSGSNSNTSSNSNSSSGSSSSSKTSSRTNSTMPDWLNSSGTAVVNNSTDALTKMAQNSAAWANADAATKVALHQRNQALGASLGLVYNEAAGTWSSPSTTTTSTTTANPNRNPNLTAAQIASMKSEMAQNSAAWASADAAGKVMLAQRNQELGAQLGLVYNQAAGTWSDPYAAAQTIPTTVDVLNNTQVQKPTFATASQDLLNGYVNYDYDKIAKLFTDATNASYDLANKQYQQTENAYNNNIFNLQNSALDTLRKNRNAAVATGASSGLQAANELLSMLGLDQQTVDATTTLANNKNLLADKQQAALAQVPVDALSAANSAGLQAANIASNLYASDTQFSASQMAALAQYQSMLKQLEGTVYSANAQADATKYASDNNLAASQNYSSNSGSGSGSGAATSAAAAETRTPANLITAGNYTDWRYFYAKDASEDAARKQWLLSGGTPTAVGYREASPTEVQAYTSQGIVVTTSSGKSYVPNTAAVLNNNSTTTDANAPWWQVFGQSVQNNPAYIA